MTTLNDGALNSLSGRRETEDERLDRNYNELLQELRVAQTGTQILFAFLLTVSFTPVMHDSGIFAHRTLTVAIVASAAATALLIAPVAFHRQLFRKQMKAELVTTASRLAQGGLVLLVVAMLASCLLAIDSVLGRGEAMWITGAVGLWFLAWWYVLPWVVRRRRGVDASPRDTPEERTGSADDRTTGIRTTTKETR